MSFKINKDNYETYKKVLDVFWQLQLRHSNKDIQSTMMENSPINVLTRWESEIPKSKLYSGLKQALGDIRELEYCPKLLAELNADLIADNLPNVYTLLRQISDSVNKVIKRQKIRNIDEYYIIKDVLDDTVSEISDDERILLESALNNFETTQKQANRG